VSGLRNTSQFFFNALKKVSKNLNLRVKKRVRPSGKPPAEGGKRMRPLNLNHSGNP
jgi:hypothetical protein